MSDFSPRSCWITRIIDGHSLERELLHEESLVSSVGGVENRDINSVVYTRHFLASKNATFTLFGVPGWMLQLIPWQVLPQYLDGCASYVISILLGDMLSIPYNVNGGFHRFRIELCDGIVQSLCETQS